MTKLQDLVWRCCNLYARRRYVHGPGTLPHPRYVTSRCYISPWVKSQGIWRLNARRTAKQCPDAIIDFVFDGVRNLKGSQSDRPYHTKFNIRYCN